MTLVFVAQWPSCGFPLWIGKTFFVKTYDGGTILMGIIGSSLVDWAYICGMQHHWGLVAKSLSYLCGSYIFLGGYLVAHYFWINEKYESSGQESSTLWYMSRVWCATYSFMWIYINYVVASTSLWCLLRLCDFNNDLVSPFLGERFLVDQQHPWSAWVATCYMWCIYVIQWL